MWDLWGRRERGTKDNTNILGLNKRKEEAAVS